MSYMPKNFADYIPALLKIPEGIYFGVEKNLIDFQAPTQELVKKVRNAFPGIIWKKEWKQVYSWWEYTSSYNGVKLKMYNVKEAPKTCKAITEKKIVEQKIPTAWRIEKIEKDVIVGYDCGPENGEDNGEPADQESQEL